MLLVIIHYPQLYSTITKRFLNIIQDRITFNFQNFFVTYNSAKSIDSHKLRESSDVDDAAVDKLASQPRQSGNPPISPCERIAFAVSTLDIKVHLIIERLRLSLSLSLVARTFAFLFVLRSARILTCNVSRYEIVFTFARLGVSSRVGIYIST